MALSILQRPDYTDYRLIPAYSDTIIVVGGGQITGNFRHKYICEVRMNNLEGEIDAYAATSIIATLKVPANADGNGVFNMNKILRDNVATGVKGIATTTQKQRHTLKHETMNGNKKNRRIIEQLQKQQTQEEQTTQRL